MTHEIREKNIFQLIRASAEEIGHRNLFTFGLLTTLVIIIGITFILTQNRQNIIQRASFDISTRTFKETFNGNPTAPEPFTQLQQNNWDVQIHLRDPQYWYSVPKVNAHHGPNCQSPNDSIDSTHSTNVFEELVFLCKDHVMTALDGGEYGMIYLTPNAMVDFSQGEAIVRWNMSTLRTSDRDWIDLWITPFEQTLALPLEDFIPDGQGQPLNAIHIRMDGSGSSGPLDAAFKIFVITNGVEKYYVPLWNPYHKFLTPDKARRDTFELRVSKNKIKLSMPGYNQVLQQGDIPTLSWDMGVVQFGHHSYNPYKSVGVPDTWHWDDVEISPAIPFTMIKGDRRYVDQNNQTVTFKQSAPENSYLRFSAIGSVDISFDNGNTWIKATRLDGTRQHAAEHFSTYHTPIPVGTQKVNLRFSKDSWYGGEGMPYMARDFAIWSKSNTILNPTITSSPTIITPTISQPTPTTALTATPTVVTPTPTKTPTPTPTPTPSPIPPTPTPSPTPTPTPTPIPPTPTPTKTQAQRADFNSSGKVDIQDLSFLLTRWGTNDTTADLSGDGKVSTFDLSILLSNWGK